VAAFTAVAYEELLWSCEGSCESDIATLAATFHVCGAHEQECDYLICECSFPERSIPNTELVLSSITEVIIDHLRFCSYNTTRVCLTYMDICRKQKTIHRS
jgi:hypothetical protein